MENKNMKVVYTVTEREGRSFWTRLGVAFTNRDGSITMKLDAVPLQGTIQLRDWEPRDDQPRSKTESAGSSSNGAGASLDAFV
jgi:hypothetical protein